jgi:hypothetical protein
VTGNGDKLIGLIQRLADKNDPIRAELNTDAGKQKHLAGLVDPDRYGDVVAGLRKSEAYGCALPLLQCLEQHLPGLEAAEVECCLKLGSPPPPPPRH